MLTRARPKHASSGFFQFLAVRSWHLATQESWNHRRREPGSSLLVEIVRSKSPGLTSQERPFGLRSPMYSSTTLFHLPCAFRMYSTASRKAPSPPAWDVVQWSSDLTSGRSFFQAISRTH